MLSDEQTEQYRQQLVALERELDELSESGEESAGTVELDQARVGRLSRMDALQGQAMLKEAQRRRKLQLAEVRRALLRIKSGEYGECQNCGEYISFERLDFKPETKFCIDCANATEA